MVITDTDILEMSALPANGCTEHCLGRDRELLGLLKRWVPCDPILLGFCAGQVGEPNGGHCTSQNRPPRHCNAD